MSFAWTRVLIALPIVFCSCQKKTDPKDFIAKVGGVTINKDNFQAFQKIAKIYPSQVTELFPGSRSLITYVVETEALFQKSRWSLANNSIKSSGDWKWKSRYFPAQLFLMEDLSQNLGFSNKQIDQYYKAHTDSFKVTVKDSTGKKDSTYLRPLSEVKYSIVENLFWNKYKPDSAFNATLTEPTTDSSLLKRRWIYSVRSNLPDFFMKEFYREQTGKKYPDSLSEIYGQGKTITPKDMDVILTWIPENRREMYKNPRGSKELVEWLLKWKLFSEKAKGIGFTSEKSFKEGMDWAWKIEVVRNYLNKKLQPIAQKNAKIDTSAVIYSFWDDYGINMQPDTQSLNRHRSDLLKEQQGMLLDSMIYSIRKDAKVKFLQTDFKDDKTQDPKVLLKQADSLRDTGNAEAAENLYRTLTTDFSFTEQGKTALVELAKVQTEKQLYQQAIKNYRKFLLSGTDASHKCNTYFMIGFIYDEYMDKPELAEVNYKWVLKNTPECELSDDAEFMMLHLGEPMTSVEELQAEAKRQGRKIEDADSTAMQNDSSELNSPPSENK